MNPNPSIPHLSPSLAAQASPNFSKWLTIEMLVDVEEMQHLLKTCDPFFFISIYDSCPSTPHLMSQAQFLEYYSAYIADLKKGEIPPSTLLKKFNLMLTPDLTGVYIRTLSNAKTTVAFTVPLIEVKPISLMFSQVDHSIYTSPVHPSGILWGIKISFPQIMQNAQTLETDKIQLHEQITGKLFKKIKQWTRDYTQATPFIIDDKKVNLPIRLGTQCFRWINNHPQIKNYPIHVALL